MIQIFIPTNANLNPLPQFMTTASDAMILHFCRNVPVINLIWHISKEDNALLDSYYKL